MDNSDEKKIIEILNSEYDLKIDKLDESSIINFLNIGDDYNEDEYLIYLQDYLITNLSTYLGEDKEKWLNVINNTTYLPQEYIPETLLNDRNFVLRIIDIPYLSEYKDDYEIALKMFQKNICYLSESTLRHNDKFMKELTKNIEIIHTPHVFTFDIDDKYKDILKSKFFNFNSIKSFCPYLDRDEKIALEMYYSGPDFFRNSIWINDENFIKKLIKINPLISDNISKYQENNWYTYIIKKWYAFIN
jgi:hypothetical protein